MAVVMRRRRIANPGRRRRRLSLKQLLHFGTKRQRASAALRLKHKRRANSGKFSWRKTKKRRGLHGSIARRVKRHYKARRRSNVGHVLSFTLNPGTKRKRRVKVMARRRRARKVSAHRRRRVVRVARRRRRNLFGFKSHRRRSYRRRRTNPVRVSRRRSYRRRRSNPGFGVGRVGGMVTQAAWTIAGVVGTRAITQAILGSKNTGVVGYAANGAAAILLGQLTAKFLRNPAAGKMVTLGGFVGIVLRIVQEYTPVGSYIKSQLGGLGDYTATTFFVPLNPSDGAASMQIPASVKALQVVPKAGMGASRYGSAATRYN